MVVNPFGMTETEHQFSPGANYFVLKNSTVLSGINQSFSLKFISYLRPTFRTVLEYQGQQAPDIVIITHTYVGLR